MIEVTASAEVDRPADEAFAFVADMENNPRWQRGMRRCVWTSAPPVDVGSTYDQHARFLGRDLVSTFEVVEFQPGRRIRIRTTSGPMHFDITREVTPVDDERSVIRATIRGGPRGPMRVLDPVTAPLVRRSVAADYRRLEALLSTHR